jgi:integrase
MTLRDASKKWYEWLDTATTRAPNTKRMYRGVVQRWLKYFKLQKVGAHRFDDGHIYRFVNRRSALKLSSRQMELKAIRAFCKWMNGKGVTRGNPSVLVELDYSLMTHEAKEVIHKVPFTVEDYELLCGLATPFWRTMMVIARNTGLRLGDCVQLQWASISKDLSHLIVWTGKHDKRVELPITREVVDAITSVGATDDPVYCFPKERELYLRRDWKFNMEFFWLVKQAGIEGKSFHSFRAMKLTELVKSGVTLEATARFAGHSSTKTTEVYINA